LDDPSRCVHIGDRESDIFELFCEAEDAGTIFVFRASVDRVAADGTRKISDVIKEEKIKGYHHIHIKGINRRPSP